jgi:hypothetical protein
MRCILLPIGLIFLALVPFSSGAPTTGTSWAYRKIEAGTESGGKITEPGNWQLSKVFVAGQRACVIVVGDHKPVVDVEIKVYDSRKNLVAYDKGSEPAQDFAAVTWYPPREEKYQIVINSYGSAYNLCSVAIK